MRLRTDMTVTFICTGNTCRSAMAEGICRKLISEMKLENINCRSCGLGAFSGDRASDAAVEVMNEMGIDISRHRSTAVNPYIIDETDLAVCMTSYHKKNLLGWFPECRAVVPESEVPDPYGGSTEVYRECAKALSGYIKKLLKVLAAELVPMEESHVGGIAEIEELCFSTPWNEAQIKEELENENAHFLCAVFDGEVLGYIGVHEVCGEAYIDNIAVRPEFRRMGLGERLISRAEDDARGRKCEFISLEVRKSNAPAIALYAKQGYNIAGERKNFYSAPVENGLIMTKYFKDCD